MGAPVLKDVVEQVHDYGVDIKRRQIFLFGNDEYGPYMADVDGPGEEPGVEYTMANQLIKNMMILESVSEDPITIHLKTCGGDWYEGMAIYTAIKRSPCHVKMIAYTPARSMSSLIFQAADDRIMTPYSWYMVHKGTHGYYGTHRQFQTEAQMGRTIDDQMMQIYVERLVACKRFWGDPRGARVWLENEMKEHEEVYFSPSTAVEYNFADSVLDVA